KMLRILPRCNMRSLLTFEMIFDDRPEKKNKGVDQSDVKKDSKDDLENFIFPLTKQFNRVMKRFNKRFGNYVPQYVNDNSNMNGRE
ncbi:unnamed protein product, partial [Citrullus colocynthis]